MNKNQFELEIINRRFKIREKGTGNKYFPLDYKIQSGPYYEIFYLDQLITSILMFLRSEYSSNYYNDDFTIYIDVVLSKFELEYIEFFKNSYDDKTLKFINFDEFVFESKFFKSELKFKFIL